MRTPDRDEMLDLVKLWWLFVLLGALSVGVGVIFVAEPSHSLATLAVVFGIFALFDGVAELVLSFVGGSQNRALAAIVGVVSVIIGILLIRHPTHVVAGIGLLIGIWLVAAGVIRLVRAVVAATRPLLQLLIAVLQVAVGIAIVANPHIGYATLAVLTGIWLIFNGIGSIGVGLAIRSFKSDPSVMSESQPAGLGRR